MSIPHLATTSNSNELDNQAIPGSPDSIDSIQELESDEFPKYFFQEDNRLFSSHLTTPYPLPVDGPEQERLERQHAILHKVLDGHVVQPVSSILAPEDGREKKVLDLCTGTGTWVVEMAELHPHVQFRGIDVVPIATRYPARNVRFEVGDINARLRWPDNTFDLVHARSISMAVQNYPALLQEVARVLRPGGVFLSCEWGRHVTLDPSWGTPAIHAPASLRFFETLVNALETSHNITPLATSIPTFLRLSGAFAQVTSQHFIVPIGSWSHDPIFQEIGTSFRRVHIRYAHSVKPLLKKSGMAVNEVDTLVDDYIDELKSINGLASVYYTVHARKL